MSAQVIELAPYIARRRRREHFAMLAGVGVFMALTWWAWHARRSA